MYHDDKFYERKLFWRSGSKWWEMITERGLERRRRREAAKPRGVGPPFKRKGPARSGKNGEAQKTDLCDEINHTHTLNQGRAQQARERRL